MWVNFCKIPKLKGGWLIIHSIKNHQKCKETALKSGPHYFTTAIKWEFIHKDYKQIAVNEARRQRSTYIVWMFVNIRTECERRAAQDILRGMGFELCTGYEFPTATQHSNAKEVQNFWTETQYDCKCRQAED